MSSVMSAPTRLPCSLLALALVACGSDPGMDMQMPPTPGDTPVQVAYRDGKPAPSVPVVVNDAAGAVVQLRRTDAQGQAAVTVPPGGSVSTFQTDGESFAYIDTINAPPAGARLYFAGYQKPALAQAPVQVQLSLVDLPPGTLQVRYASSCTTGTQPANAPSFTLTCDEPIFDVVLVAVGSQGRKLGWGSLLAMPVAPGQVLQKQVSLGNTDFAQLEMEVSGVPSGKDAQARLRAYPVWKMGRPFPYPIDQVSGDAPMGGALRATLAVPATLGQAGLRARASYGVSYPDDWRYTASAIVYRDEIVATSPVRTTFAAGAAPLVQVLVPDLGEPLHPKVSWQGAGFGDYGVALIEYQTASKVDVDWEVWSAPERASGLRLPDLPPELAAFAPRAGGWITYAGASLYDYDGVQGFADYIAKRQELATATSPSNKTVAQSDLFFDPPRPTAWQTVPTGSSAGLFGVGPGDNLLQSVWAVGEGGQTLLWNGTRWTSYASTATELRSITNTYLAVGRKGAIMDWDGGRWVARSSGTTEDLYATASSGAGTIWIVGAGGTILEGPSWDKRQGGTTKALYALWVSQDENLWIVGEGGTILQGDGTSFTAQPSPSDAAIQGVWGADEEHVWAVDSKGQILYWDGAAWSVQKQTGAPLMAVGGYGAQDVWAVGAGGAIWRWDGKAWAKESSGTTADLRGIWADDPGSLWIVGAGGVVLHSGQ